MPKIAILILNLNGKKWLETLYPSLLSSDYPHFDIFLLDNGSRDESIRFTRENFPQISIIGFEKNLGFSVAYNIATPSVFKMGFDYVIWSNADVLVERECLSVLAGVASLSPSTGILGPAFLNWDGSEPNYYMKGKHPQLIKNMMRRERKAFDVDWVEGSFMMVKKECFEDVGFFDPLFSYSYWEDADFCRRARRKGWRVVLVPGAWARHYGRKGAGGDRKVFNYLLRKNQYIYNMADPGANFFIFNFLKGIKLFLTNVKENIFEGNSVLNEMKVFKSVMRDVKNIYRKWQRDKNLESPKPFEENLIEEKIYLFLHGEEKILKVKDLIGDFKV